MEAFISSGGEFPPDFDGADIVPWGTMTIDFTPGGTANISWTTNQPGYSNGSLAVTRISTLGGHECAE